MNSTVDNAPKYWVITESEEAFGPYDTEAAAYLFATINLGFEGWEITST